MCQQSIMGNHCFFISGKSNVTLANSQTFIMRHFAVSLPAMGRHATLDYLNI
jgi:hypothetical protein